MKRIVTDVPVWAYWGGGLLFLVGACVVYFNHKKNNIIHIRKFEETAKGRANDNTNYWWRGIARLMLMEWVVLIFCSAVIFREARAERAISLVPLSSYFCIAENSYLKEVAVINLLNICMFLPVGFFLKCGYRNVTYKKVLFAGFMVSSFIELSQFIFRKGLCEVDDLIHNVAGCMVGYAIATLILTESNDKNKKKIKR